MAGAGAECLHRLHRERPESIQRVDARRLSARADFGVELRRGRTQLSHVAEDQDARTRYRSEYGDRCLYRIRIGVVCVVDQRRSARGILALEPALHAASKNRHT